MGDTSPKNIHKLAEQKHEEHEKKEQHKHDNAEVQHHAVSHPPDAEQVKGLPETEKK